MKSPGHGKMTGSFDAECLATREILTRVGDNLKRIIQGISQRMLTLTP